VGIGKIGAMGPDYGAGTESSGAACSRETSPKKITGWPRRPSKTGNAIGAFEDKRSDQIANQDWR